MVRKVVAECDICGRPDAREWEISVNGSRWKVDLCEEEHGAAIRDMVKHGREEVAGGVSPTPIRTKSYERLVRNVPPMADGSG